MKDKIIGTWQCSNCGNTAKDKRIYDGEEYCGYCFLNLEPIKEYSNLAQSISKKGVQLKTVNQVLETEYKLKGYAKSNGSEFTVISLPSCMIGKVVKLKIVSEN